MAVIKRWDNGKVIIEDGNLSIKELAEKAVREGISLAFADLCNADFRYADLRDANFQDTDLRDVDFRHADLRYANFRDAAFPYAKLRYANLRNADLQSSHFWYANFKDADLRDALFLKKGIKIKKLEKWDNLYEYIVIALIDTSGVPHIKMGGAEYTLEEWEANFWGNDKEFPNDGSTKSNRRLRAFEFAKAWIMEELDNV